MGVTPEIVPYVSAISVMLAAYGFFYNALRGQIEAGSNVGDRAANETALKAQRESVDGAKHAALLLGLIPFFVWLVFLKPVVEEVEAAIDVCFSLHHYSALDVAFVLLANSWLLIGILQLLQVRKLTKKRKTLN